MPAEGPGSPTSIRIEPELKDWIDRHLAMRALIGDKITVSELIRESLYAHLGAVDTALKEESLKALNS